MKRKNDGQSMLELALILPILLLLIIAVVEVGFAMRNYLLVMTTNRDGVRFAARGRFTDDAVAQRVIAAGGSIHTADGNVPFLRTTVSPNTGIIITHIFIPEDGDPDNVTISHYVTGTVSYTSTRYIQPADSRINITDIVTRQIAATIQINDLREAAGYERLGSDVIVLEVFYAHEPLWRYDFVPISAPWVMYTQSSMRVVSDSRQD